MVLDMSAYLPELLSLSMIAIFMAISPGADFIMITRNSIFYGRSAGLYSAMGVSLSIWIHVAYSIAGLAIIIANSIILFSIIKYLGAAYLIYIGWKTFQSKSNSEIEPPQEQQKTSNLSALKMGFTTNALNPKTTIFFLSIFTQIVDPHTPLWIQIIYGAIISLTHLLWFSAVALFLSQPVLLKKFQACRHAIEKLAGSLLIAFGIKVATSNNIWKINESPPHDQKRGNSMIPPKYQHLVFSFLMALFMSCFMSLVISIFNVGIISDIVFIWLKAWGFAFVAAFPAVLMLSPIAKKLTQLIVKKG